MVDIVKEVIHEMNVKDIARLSSAMDNSMAYVYAHISVFNAGMMFTLEYSNDYTDMSDNEDWNGYDFCMELDSFVDIFKEEARLSQRRLLAQYNRDELDYMDIASCSFYVGELDDLEEYIERLKEVSCIVDYIIEDRVKLTQQNEPYRIVRFTIKKSWARIFFIMIGVWEIHEETREALYAIYDAYTHSEDGYVSVLPDYNDLPTILALRDFEEYPKERIFALFINLMEAML